MASEVSTTQITDDNSSSDLIRKIVAAVVGLIIIIGIVLLAKWLGDQIKAKFIDKKTTTVQTVTTTNNAAVKKSVYSTSPSTGPNDNLYIVLGVMTIGGIGILTFSKKLSAN